ncbi:hypothetical protein AB4455_26215 [Vibrio sp. 10N.261.46.E12]|uniref:hypothetical protein n=1 Tax=unclassified Vibrio TaxID=2614977 RepID=UPI000976BB2B|nr:MULTISPECIES: hypothetical protein [unclassified Vibrio]OMO37696.1 hypothetical protein BH584_21425 [Vibrio sp. 10N.261.45.E1]PMJ36886.1 hypothetical protein BCU27_22700 [Vibrio sp. 10N.286.45.B6]PML93599.1 hypothetical protein BCT66_24345 [Vibrio sp. 10N.261.49.E11]PMM86142.1 hypothetical protein BCT46_08645 [Vibrio sp. 10N.261.46.E8]PMN50173.1 hypothetical protein BCT32_04855 [Vibrio sp. 10N.261.45.E11]
MLLHKVNSDFEKILAAKSPIGNLNLADMKTVCGLNFMAITVPIRGAASLITIFVDETKKNITITQNIDKNHQHDWLHLAKLITLYFFKPRG